MTRKGDITDVSRFSFLSTPSGSRPVDASVVASTGPSKVGETPAGRIEASPHVLPAAPAIVEAEVVTEQVVWIEPSFKARMDAAALKEIEAPKPVEVKKKGRSGIHPNTRAHHFKPGNPTRITKENARAMRARRTLLETTSAPKVLRALVTSETQFDAKAALDAMMGHPLLAPIAAAIQSDDVRLGSETAFRTLERIIGKPVQTTEITGLDGGPLWMQIQAAVAAPDYEEDLI